VVDAAQMNSKVTITFAILAALLFGAIFFLKPLMESPRDRERFGDYLFGFSTTDVESVAIERGGEKLDFRRLPDGWEMGYSLRDRASVSHMEKILSSAQNLKVLDRISGRKFERNLKSEDFGLASPKQRLTLSLPGEELVVHFGREGAGEERVFVRSGDSKETFLVPSGLQQLILAPLEEFRDPRLVSLPADRIERLRIYKDTGEIDLERQGRRWMLVRPLQARANTERIDALLENLLGARVFLFPKEDSSPAEGQWGGEILVWPEGEDEPIQIRYRKDPGALWTVYQSARDLTAGTHPDNLEIASLSLDDFRSTNLLDLNPDLVDRFAILFAGHSHDFSRSPKGGWTLQSTGHILEVDEEKVDAFFDAINEFSVGQPLSGGASTDLMQSPADLEMQFNSWLSENTPEAPAGLHPVAELRFWKNPEGLWLAQSNEDRTLRELNTEAMEFVHQWIAALLPSPPKPSTSPKE